MRQKASYGSPTSECPMWSAGSLCGIDCIDMQIPEAAGTFLRPSVDLCRLRRASTCACWCKGMSTAPSVLTVAHVGMVCFMRVYICMVAQCNRHGRQSCAECEDCDTGLGVTQFMPPGPCGKSMHLIS